MRASDNCLCNYCDHNLNWHRCGCDNEDFLSNDLTDPDDCEDFDPGDDDDDDDDDNGDDVIECPNCRGDAYWNGSEYECDDCGWCG